MKTVQKSVLIWHSAHKMFALVADVDHYPQFLPWCDRAQVLERVQDGMVARIGMAVGGLHKAFTTRNTHVPDRQIRMTLIDGPFSHLDGCWRFEPVGEAQDGACRIHFEVHYAFASRALATLVGPIFDRIAGSLVDAFVQRADVVYGDTP